MEPPAESTLSVHSNYIDFRSDALTRPDAPFQIVGKIGHEMWCHFLKDVQRAGVINDR